jgi:hypothetical protein
MNAPPLVGGGAIRKRPGAKTRPFSFFAPFVMAALEAAIQQASISERK